MLKKFIYGLTAVLVVVSVLAVTVPASALSSNSNALIKGTIIAVTTSTRTLTVKPLTGKPVNIKVAPTTLVTRDGKASSFLKLRVGDKTNLKYDTSTKQATNVDDSTELYEIHGTVEAVDTTAGRITIASEEGGNSVLLIVNASTVIKRNGAPANLGRLLIGDKVEAKYDSANMIASLIKGEMEDRDFHGKVAALNFTGKTVTITPKLGGANVVLNITASTVFINNNVVIAFNNLYVGESVEAKYDSVTKIASMVKVDH